MEAKFNNDAIITTENIISQEKKRDGKKRRSRSNFLKAALYFFRHGSHTSKSAQVDVANSKDAWKKVVGSMRPLHLQASQSPPPSVHKRGHDQSMKLAISSTPPSSIYMSSPSSSQYASTENLQDLVHSSFYQASPSSSQYASAHNLQELITQSEENLKNEGHPDGDDMIDAKAELFIAQFYERMKLERHSY